MSGDTDACLNPLQNRLSVCRDDKVWYLTNDKRQSGLMARFAAEHNYPIVVYEIETAQQHLTAQADATLEQMLENKTAGAEGVLRWPSQRLALASFMKKRLDVPLPVPQLIGYVVEWADLIVESISSIAVGGDRADGEVDYRRVSFVATATAGALVRRLRRQGPLAEIPQYRQPLTFLPAVPMDAVAADTESPEYVALTVEAEINGQGDIAVGEYIEFDFISLRVKRIEPR